MNLPIGSISSTDSEEFDGNHAVVNFQFLIYREYLFNMIKAAANGESVFDFQSPIYREYLCNVLPLGGSGHAQAGNPPQPEGRNPLLQPRLGKLEQQDG